LPFQQDKKARRMVLRQAFLTGLQSFALKIGKINLSGEKVIRY
jgi:hypothetical protein